MTDFNTNLTDTIDALTAKVADLTNEREEARLQRDRAVNTLSELKSSLQYDLKEWAEQYIVPGTDDYKELSELMVNNGLEGLKRSLSVTVRVTYEFEVEVESTDEDEARYEVDNNLSTYVGDNVSLWDTPDYYDIDVT